MDCISGTGKVQRFSFIRLQLNYNAFLQYKTYFTLLHETSFLTK